MIVVCRCGADLWRLLVSRISGTRRGKRHAAGLHRVVTPALLGVAVLLDAGARRHCRLALVALLPGLAAVVVLCATAGWNWLPNQLFVKRLLYGVAVGGLTLLLAAFWVGPFLFNHAYMTDMKYGFKPDGGSESFWSMLFDQEPFLDVLINTLAIVGLLASIARRHVLRDRPRPHRPDRRRDGVPDPRQPAGHRAAVEPADAAVGLPDALPDDDDRCRRGRRA